MAVLTGAIPKKLIRRLVVGEILVTAIVLGLFFRYTLGSDSPIQDDMLVKLIVIAVVLYMIPSVLLVVAVIRSRATAARDTDQPSVIRRT